MHLTIEGRKPEAHLRVKVGSREDETAGDVTAVSCGVQREPRVAPGRCGRAGGGARAGRAGAPRLGRYLPGAHPALRQPSSPGPSAAAPLLRCEDDIATPASALPPPHLGKTGGRTQQSVLARALSGPVGATEGILFCLVLRWLIKEKKVQAWCAFSTNLLDTF